MQLTLTDKELLDMMIRRAVSSANRPLKYEFMGMRFDLMQMFTKEVTEEDAHKAISSIVSLLKDAKRV